MEQKSTPETKKELGRSKNGQPNGLNLVNTNGRKWTPVRPHVAKAIEANDFDACWDGLTDRQRSFVEEYMKDLDSLSAVRRSTYETESNETAYVMQNKLMSNPAIRFCIDKIKEQRANSTDITADFVLKKLLRIANTTEDANPQAAIRSLELIAKHLGMFIERTEISGRDGEAIKYEKAKEDADDFSSRISSLAKRGGKGNLAIVPDDGATG